MWESRLWCQPASQPGNVGSSCWWRSQRGAFDTFFEAGVHFTYCKLKDMLIKVFVKVFINTVKIALVKILLKTGTLLSEVLMKNHLETIELCLPHHSSLNDQIFNYDWDDEYDDGCFGICEFHNVKKRIVMMIFDGGGNFCA